jgi:hypothetical protein
VNDQELHPSADITAADWLGPRLRRFGSAVAAVVPDGFPAYVRILHPGRGPEGRPVRWAEVAAWSSRTMHRLAQFHAISRPAVSTPTGPAPWDGEDPPDGNLPAELLGILCATLAEHTSTPSSCWFCLWDGYGWLHGSPSVAIMSNHGSIPVPAGVPCRGAGGTPRPTSEPGLPAVRRSVDGSTPARLDRPLRLLLPPVTQPVLAAGPRLVRRLRDRPVLHPGRRVRGPRPGADGRPAP